MGLKILSVPSLQALIDAGYKISAVITKPDSKQGRGHKLMPPVIKTLAIQNGIEVLQPLDLLDIHGYLRSLDEPLGVLVSYGKIIPKQIIDLFTPGVINVHPSLLPKYRGPSPIEAAILNGDSKTGITIMKLSEKMDAGPIYAQSVMPLYKTETGPYLSDVLAELGSKELVRLIPSIIDGSLLPTPQDERLVSYSKLLQKSDGELNPSEQTADLAEKQVRAFMNFPKTKFKINGHSIIVTKAHTTDTPATDIDIRFKDGAYLSIDELVAPSGRKMNAKDFINGYIL